MKTTEKLDVRLQGLVLAIGQGVSEFGASSRRVSARRTEQPITADILEEEVKKVLKAVRASPARKLFGIRQGYADSDDQIRLKAVAYIAWEMISSTGMSTHVEEITRSLVDGKGSPWEQIILTRDCLGRMVIEGVLSLNRSEGSQWTGRLILPRSTLAWMTGGSKSMADFDQAKLDVGRLKRGTANDDESSATKVKMPTAKLIYEAVRQEVVGLDPQIKVLASRIALHAARAEMLKSGNDDQSVGAMVCVLMGSSGSGKSFLASRLAAHCGLGFCQYDSTTLTSQGYVGSDLDEPYRLLVNSLGGNTQEASRGIILFDEFDKKSLRNGRDSVCTAAIQNELLGRLQAMSPFVVGGKRAFDARPILFDGRRTGYFLAGVFSGLDEIIEKMSGRRDLGFACETGSRRHIYIQDALKDFGFIDELVNRIGCVVRLPDPTVASLKVATAGVLQKGFCDLLITRGIVLHLNDTAVRLIAAYGFESKMFFRGCRQILGVIAEELMFEAKPSAYLIVASDVRRAINRLTSGLIQPDNSGDSTRTVDRSIGDFAEPGLSPSAEPGLVCG